MKTHLCAQGFAGPPLKTVREASKKPIKVYLWHSGSVSAVFHLLGPEKYGGRKDPLGRIQAQVANGKDATQATFEVTVMFPIFHILKPRLIGKGKAEEKENDISLISVFFCLLGIHRDRRFDCTCAGNTSDV